MTGGAPDLIKQAKAARQQRRLDEAIRLYSEAVEILREEADALALAHAIRHLGDVRRETGQADLAESCYCEALGLYRNNEQTSPLDLANAIRPLAILKGAAGDTAVARELWEEARILYAATSVDAGVVECTDRLAKLD